MSHEVIALYLDSIVAGERLPIFGDCLSAARWRGAHSESLQPGQH